jgi:hypothetical protein
MAGDIGRRFTAKAFDLLGGVGARQGQMSLAALMFVAAGSISQTLGQVGGIIVRNRGGSRLERLKIR